MQTELICITCPAGCRLEVQWEETDSQKQILSVRGNSCPRGDAYARAELIHPTRMVTGTAVIRGALYPRLPVVTSVPVPKEKIFDIMEQIHAVQVSAPVSLGDCIIKDVCHTGADILASRTMEALPESSL